MIASRGRCRKIQKDGSLKASSSRTESAWSMWIFDLKPGKYFLKNFPITPGYRVLSQMGTAAALKAVGLNTPNGFDSHSTHILPYLKVRKHSSVINDLTCPGSLDNFRVPRLFPLILPTLTGLLCWAWIPVLDSDLELGRSSMSIPALLKSGSRHCRSMGSSSLPWGSLPSPSVSTSWNWITERNQAPVLVRPVWISIEHIYSLSPTQSDPIHSILGECLED